MNPAGRIPTTNPDMEPSVPPAFETAPDGAGDGAWPADWGGLPLLTLLEGMGDGVWDWDMVSGLEHFSPRLKSIYGYEDCDDLRFATDLDGLTHPDDVPQMQADRQAHWSGQVASYRNEHRVRHKDGRWIWVLTRGLVVARAADGKPLRMVGTHTGITERKHAELALRTTRERLELATRGSNDGLWDWDLVTDKVYYSTRFQQLLGYDGVDVFEEIFSFRSHLHPDDAARVLRHLHAHLRGHRPGFDEEYRLRCRSGEYRWFHGRGLLATGADGQPTRFAGHLTDVTERVNAQATRHVLEERLRDSQKLEAMGNLAGGLAKAFGQVLDTMLEGLARARRELPAPHPALSPLLSVSQAAEHALALVQQIRVFGRRQPQRMAVLDLGALVGRGVVSARTAAPDGVTVRLSLPPDPLFVLADASQLNQVILNLCTHASLALAGQVGEVHVAVAPATDGAGALLVVHDSGPGTPADVLGRLFEPFYPGSGDGAAGAMAMGLGLAVVHGIVEAHQGRIGVTSVPGQGTRFEVWLPRVADPQPASTTAAPAAPASVVAAPAVAGAARVRHVVYIDDYEAMVYLVTRMLKKRGYRVSAFERAQEALAFIEAHPDDMDLLVTDYNMPGFSGLDVVRRVKLCRPDMPMVITSGHVTPGMLAEALTEGVAQVLSKQDSVEELANVLAQILDALPPRT